MKEKKVIEQRYNVNLSLLKNTSQIKDPVQQRQSIRDYITLQIY